MVGGTVGAAGGALVGSAVDVAHSFDWDAARRTARRVLTGISVVIGTAGASQDGVIKVRGAEVERARAQAAEAQRKREEETRGKKKQQEGRGSPES